MSIHKTLALLVFSSVMLVTTTGTLFIAYHVIQQLSDELIEDADSTAQLIQQDLVKILSFGTPDLAAELTERLRNLPKIHCLTLFDDTQQILFRYRQHESSFFCEKSDTGVQSVAFTPDGTGLELRTSVQYQGKPLGSVLMMFSTVALQQAQKQAMQQAGMILLGALFASSLLIYLVRRTITRPIQQLSETLTQVSATHDHSLRLPVDREDEIGQLYQGFNALQREIEKNTQALKLSNERFELALSVTNDGIWDWQIGRNQILVDPRFYALTGHQPGEYPATLLEWRKRVHPDDLNTVMRSIRAHLAGQTGEFSAEYRYLHKQGYYMWVRGRGRVVQRDDNGQALRMVGSHADITRRKLAELALVNSETKYRSFFEKTGDAIITLDDDGRFIDINPAAVTLLGYDNDDQLHGLKPHDISPPQQADGKSSEQKAREMIELCWQRGTHRFEWELSTREGEVVPVEVLLTHIVVGDTDFIQSVFRDISERRQTEQALRRSQKMEAIGQLTGGIAHDFNNILGIVLGNLSLLEIKMRGADEAIQKRLDTIKLAADRAVKLTSQLLSFSRQQPASLQTCNLNRILNDMNSLIAHSLTPQIEVQYKLEETLWPTDIDPGDLSDSILNLVLNARDAMPNGGRLSIETANRTLDDTFHIDVEPGDYVELVISDNGVGIESALLDRIFEPFFTTKEQGKGTGLGMAMVFGFVKRSGGSIKIYSEVDIGTTVRIYLPRSRQQQAPPAETVSAATPPPAQGQGRILIVDDEADLLELVEESLQSLGYDTLTAADGKQALALLAEHSDIVLLFSDVVMPGGINGFELAEQVSDKYPHVRILLTSGYTDTAIAQNGQSRFQANVLSKPYSLHDMAERIRDTLQDGNA